MKQLGPVLLVVLLLTGYGAISAKQEAHPADSEAVGRIHATVCAPEGVRNFKSAGHPFCELSLGERGFVVEGSLEEDATYVLFYDDRGTPEDTDDVLVSVRKLI